MKKFKLAALGGTAITGAGLGAAGLGTAGLVSASLMGAAGVALMPESAQAQATLANQSTFARESFPSASQVAVNSVTLVFSSSTFSSAAGDIVTFRLSNGATFSGAPTVATGASLIAVTSNGLSGDSTTASYTITTGSTTGTITLSGFTLLNVGSRLGGASPSTITVTATSTNAAFSTTSAAATLASSTASTFFTSAGSTVTVDIANGGLGRTFRVSGTNQTFANVGSVILSNAASPSLKTPDNINTLTLSASDTAAFTLTGDFTGVGSTYLTTAACAATAPSGAITGTISGSSASYSALVTTTYNVCMVATGSTVLNGNGNSFTASGAVSFGGRSTAPGGASYTPAFISSASTFGVAGPLAYNGTVANFNFYFGTTGSYTQFLNVANSTTASASVLVVARPTSGATSSSQSTVSGTLDTALGAGASRLYSSTDVSNALNGNVFNGVRGTITVLVSTTGASIANIVLNPNGGINNLQ